MIPAQHITDDGRALAVGLIGGQAVLIGGKQAGQVNVVAMTFLKGRFSGGIDLAPYGNSPAKFIAYAGLYNENAVVQKEAADAAAKDGAAAQGQ